MNKSVIVLFFVIFFLIGFSCSSLALKAEASVKSRATVSVGSDAIYSYGYFNVFGCGYVPLQGVTVVWKSPAAISFSGGPADTDGCISLKFTSNEPGQYTLTTYQYIRNVKKSVQMAQTSFVVQP